MLSTVFTILVVLWSIRILGNVVTFAHLWWVKEYRFDRMFIHLRTPQGKLIYFSSWKHPPITLRSFAFIIITLGTLGTLIFFLPTTLGIRFLIADVVSFPVTFLVVFLLTLPVQLYHRYEIAQAVQKLRQFTSLFVIGITGSFGKTSTKEYLEAILATSKKTLKTQASKNSAVGIAEVVLGELRRDHEVFIAEMGAYKRGEVAEMTAMVRPQVGILTAINPQHQDLFGSLENTMAAKYELLAGLSGKQIAIVNGDDPRVREMAGWAKRDGMHVWVYTREYQKVPEAEKMFVAEKITADFSGIDFLCREGDKKVAVHAPVLGKHQVTNILAAIAGAVASGMTFADAAKGASRIRPAQKVLELLPGVGGATYIDDTFNNNPDAAQAAIDVLAMGKGKKILVFQPMIELGAYATLSHEDVGRHAGAICDAIILTNKNWSEYFLKGVRTASSKVPVLVLSPHKASVYIRSHTKKSDIVLFKGKEAGRALTMLQRG